MRPAYDAATVRAAEQPLLDTLPAGTLMQRAAFALARRCAALLGRVYGARVVVLAGPGGNGGDAMYAGARLAARGARVDALLLSERVHPHALAELRASGARVRPAGGDADAATVAAADLVIDGMLGIGATGPLREPMARLVPMCESAGLVVAVDVPSGVNASTGDIDGEAVTADVTVTFGVLKPGLVVSPGAEHAGRVEVVDIGLTLPPPTMTVLDAADVAELVAEPDPESDKYRRGVVGIVAGSDTYTGAAQLAVGGALSTGVGMVRFAGVAHPAEMVRQRWPEAVVTEIDPGDGAAVIHAGRVQAWAIGSGLGTDDAAGAVIAAVLGTDVPVVLDADAVTWLADHRDALASRSAVTLLTPHAGEFARLMDVDRGDVEAHRLHHARQAAAHLGVTVLLKGASTIVADPDGTTRINTASTPYLATAGSGDVLSGICGALLAAGLDPLDAGSAGAFIHGMAGLLATGEPATTVTALEIVEAIPSAMRAIRR
ncbi:MAG: NAD(P)H-hydrate dehydratase [Frankiaceae bacterium]|nr:NAD(P)H-hydrate dehydratase [Frankiaceae bacterium]MBV9871670.1 NAD(P)H-hydrate dehydratase [Frankiaceae bacterium]